ncbi:alpha-amylase family glycosyl hydrolase [Streptomyces sp. WMMB 322]|uniref:alpha-amylase family glycosyl hydrolase n=1 Tax=Streptomyces sp. WMMB 322 TaxID=1286821 RepID=UPI0006E345B3|nr:alpha-amylase family glycosyl hydrolase [Streptomyces sp. WMMB 322]SCK19203.1 alpha-glucosidase [Streptomyces sp. WMMB 322]
MDNRYWWQDAVFYQIYPRSFADSDGDGVGDLPGITANLDHFSDATWGLGVDALWLSPFYPSPGVDFGYDISDHCAVDPVFGTLADFDELLAAAHRRGLRIVTDLVPNHTSDQHSWFLDSRSGRGSKRRDWYIWAEPSADGGPPNNWLSCFPATGSAWTLDEQTGQYYLHSFTRHQPDLNWWNPQVRSAFAEVMRFWLNRGVDGFRVDVPHRILKDPDLRDNPPELAGMRRAAQAPAGTRPRNLDHPGIHDVMRGLRRVLDACPDRMMVGEVGITDPRQLATYSGDGDELHLAFNFAFWSQPWSADRFRQTVAVAESTTPSHAWPTYALSNHDLPRAATRYNHAGHGPARMRLAAMMLLALRGTPFLYYGEEIGMTDAFVPATVKSDPDGRDSQRSPMQWDDSEHCGFTTGRPWLPTPAGSGGVNVAAQRGDPRSLLSLYRDLLAIRHRHRPLTRGTYEAMETGSDGVFAFQRRTRAERLLIALNFAATPATVRIPGLPAAGRRLLSTLPGPKTSIVLDPLRLAAHEGVIVQLPQAKRAR